MPGVYTEYIKSGRFVVPVELNFQTETLPDPSEIGGYYTTSRWVDRNNWKEIKAMLKPAVEACIKYNETPLDKIPKDHLISYGREVSLGYLIVSNTVLNTLSVLDPKKHCWTDDEDDDDLLGLGRPDRMKDHGGEFEELFPTKTAVRVCVVRKSVVSIEDARRIRKQLGVRSDDVRNYFSANKNLHKPGPSSATHFLENHQHLNGDDDLHNGPDSVTNDAGSGSDSNSDTDDIIPRTFGDLDEIRDAARVYPLVINRDADSGEDPDDDLSLPDIEPNPPKKKKAPRARKKSQSLSPSKSKRLTHNNILAISQDLNGQTSLPEEDVTYNKRGTKTKTKRKRTVAVVEPMRTLANGQISFEHAIGALGIDKRRKTRPGSSHGADKTHSSGSRSKQPPAIDIVAPDDDRLTITSPPEPLLPVASASTATTHLSPFEEAERQLEEERLKLERRRKERYVNLDENPHKYERLTPDLFTDDEEEENTAAYVESSPYETSSDESDVEMPVLTKMVDSDIENKEAGETNNSNSASVASQPKVVTSPTTPVPSNLHSPSRLIVLSNTAATFKPIVASKTAVPSKADATSESSANKSGEERTPVVNKQKTNQNSPDITQMKFDAIVRKNFAHRIPVKRKLTLISAPNNTVQVETMHATKLSPNISEHVHKTSESRTSQKPPVTSPRGLSPVAQALRQKKETSNSQSQDDSETEIVATKKKGRPKKTPLRSGSSPVNIKPPLRSPTANTKTSERSARSPPRSSNSTKPPAESSPVQTKSISKSATISTKAAVKAFPTMIKPPVRSPLADPKPPSSVATAKLPGTPTVNTQSSSTVTSPVNIKPSVTAPAIPEVVQCQKLIHSEQSESSKRKKKLVKRVKRNSVSTDKDKEPWNAKPANEKPKMMDCQTQTDDLSVVAYIEKNHGGRRTPNGVVKISRSCVDSSEEDLYEISSPRSRSILASPNATSDASHPTAHQTTMYHPALGSPETELEDEGLFSFESPSLPVVSSQTSILITDHENSVDEIPFPREAETYNHADNDEYNQENVEPEDNGNNDSHQESSFPEPTSPQPGCSYWPSPPRPVSPYPPPRVSNLMPPPLARPPRTPRKLFGSEDDYPPPSRLSTDSLEENPTNMQEGSNELDTMLIGEEAYSVPSNAGDIYNSLKQPDMLKTGMQMFERVKSNEISAKEIKDTFRQSRSKTKESDMSKALVPVSVPQRKRDLSPDICDVGIVPDKKLRLIVASRSSVRDTLGDSENDGSSALVPRTDLYEDEISSDDEDNIDESEPSYQPHGDEFDLSQRSFCMLKIIPQYDLKSRLYKIHSKAIRETTVKIILGHYNAIEKDLFAIFRGERHSIRHMTFITEVDAKRLLRDLNVTVPFTSEQASALSLRIYDRMIPDRTQRTDYMDYVNYVLIPEAFIRIYARINNISHQQAEIEMRYRAAYLGKVPNHYLTHPDTESPE